MHEVRETDYAETVQCPRKLFKFLLSIPLDQEWIESGFSCSQDSHTSSKNHTEQGVRVQ
jgi:hypothetical protein